MWQYAAKVFITVALVIAVSEVGKRSSLLGAVLTSLPLTSLLAFIWLYTGTGDVQAVTNLSRSIFWLILATLPLFLVFPALLQRGLTFWPALAAACTVTVFSYLGLVWALGRFSIRL